MLVIGAEFKSTKFNDFQGLKKAAKGCTKPRWRLSGEKFGLMMRMANDRQACDIDIPDAIE